MTDMRGDSSDRDQDRGSARLRRDTMEHLHQLTTTWLRTPARPFGREQTPAAPELPDREIIREMAEEHHRQLVKAKRQGRDSSDALHAQTESLRRYTLQFTAQQAERFMNAYTEESSAVEREWLAKHTSHRSEEPLVLILINTLIVLAALLVIGGAIYYVL